MTINREKRPSYIVLVAGLIIYLAMVAFPTIFSIGKPDQLQRRAHLRQPGHQFVGMKSYIWMFTSLPNFYALGNNLLIVVSVCDPWASSQPTSVPNLIRRGNKLFQTMIYLPNVISPIIIGILFYAIINGRNSVLMEVRRLISPRLPSCSTPPPWCRPAGDFVDVHGLLHDHLLANLQRIDPASSRRRL